MCIRDSDGSMARLPELMEIARKFDFKIISIKDLIEYRIKSDSLIEEIVRVEMPTQFGDFQLVAFKEKNSTNEHLALIKGIWEKDEPVLTRVHSSCFTGDILGSLRCDCGEQLHAAMKMVQAEGKGAILYMNQEGRGIAVSYTHLRAHETVLDLVCRLLLEKKKTKIKKKKKKNNIRT